MHTLPHQDMVHAWVSGILEHNVLMVQQHISMKVTFEKVQNDFKYLQYHVQTHKHTANCINQVLPYHCYFALSNQRSKRCFSMVIIIILLSSYCCCNISWCRQRGKQFFVLTNWVYLWDDDYGAPLIKHTNTHLWWGWLVPGMDGCSELSPLFCPGCHLHLELCHCH